MFWTTREANSYLRFGSNSVASCRERFVSSRLKVEDGRIARASLPTVNSKQHDSFAIGRVARRAVSWLERARAQGLFKNATARRKVESDEDLGALRSRDDFKRFLSAVKQRN